MDRVLVNQVRAAAARGKVKNRRPTVVEALVHFVREADGRDVPVDHIVRRIAAMNSYQRVMTTARVWRTHQPDPPPLTAAELEETGVSIHA